jgi:hypothetical protein
LQKKRQLCAAAVVVQVVAAMVVMRTVILLFTSALSGPLTFLHFLQTGFSPIVKQIN